MKNIYFYSNLLVDHLTLFKQATRRLQFALLHVDESQQPEWIGTVEDVIQFPKSSQTLLGQLLCECLILMRHKEQTCLQETYPAKALLIAQFLVECEALL